MKFTRIEEKLVRIGNTVGFKSDIEQEGRITDILESPFGNVMLVLENKNGFSGDYLRGAVETSVEANSCWFVKK